MKKKILYHKSCFDGICAAMAAWKVYGTTDTEYIAVQYGEIKTIEDLEKLGDLNLHVYILDFSFEMEILNEIKNRSVHVVWLDHHESSFKKWLGKEYDTSKPHFFSDDKLSVCLDNDRSGALIAWEFFNPETTIPDFIKFADDGDRWKFLYKDTKAFTKAVWSEYPWNFEKLNEWFFENPEVFYPKFIADGGILLKAHYANVESVIRGGSRRCEIMSPGLQKAYGTDTLYCLAVNCPPHLQSDVGHRLALETGTFALLWYLDKYNLCKCSLRSTPEFDTTELAENFGGGGHKTATGFTIDIQTLLKWIK